ncbi:hypothetical protein [Campylobacter californiensis]|uniref:hypothetical protein n=1 Tax=Campylobacter californiensis TaxID=1032243 RepID=UPI002AD2A46D|nr:hypothetical protein [Campylobacter sp. RM13119]
MSKIKNYRAKIFSSFNPLSTLSKALREQERQASQKLEIDEAKAYENLEILSTLKPGDNISLTYHDGFDCIHLIGLTTQINLKLQKINIVKTEINFNDIYDITKNS